MATEHIPVQDKQDPHLIAHGKDAEATGIEGAYPLTTWRSGEPMVWITAAATGTVVLLFLALLTVVAFNGLRTFWARDVVHFTLKDDSQILGSVMDVDEEAARIQLFTANRDILGLDFRWMDKSTIDKREKPETVVVLERVEKGNFIGFLQGLKLGNEDTFSQTSWQNFKAAINQIREDGAGLKDIEARMAKINYRIEKLRLEMLRNKNKLGKVASLEAKMELEQESYQNFNKQFDEIRARLRQRQALFLDGSNREKAIALVDIVRAYQPNAMNAFDKLGLYASKVWELMVDPPRESNTEGGLFPAIFGTVMMVFLMSLVGVPLGVMAAVYLREYAKDGVMVRLVRIAVNNLAGVPSIVYGIFGLGFFVYGIGGSLDQLFFSEKLPIPTFGTEGLLWASLTMALLTVPVVIVSTEEGLNAVPQGVRDGAIALGATKLQTLLRVVLPMASPGILTGLILSIARAAGEVAPLMLVGAVKVAPALPLDGNAPYLHLERKFMHLGFHIFDVGFQSPNVEAAKPMVYVTTLLLLALVLGMSFIAMYLRNKMKKRFTAGAF